MVEKPEERVKDVQEETSDLRDRQGGAGLDGDCDSLPGAEVFVHAGGHLATLGDGPHDQRGAALDVAAGEHAFHAGHVVLVHHHVAARVILHAQAVEQPFFTGPVKPIANRTRFTSISNSVPGMGMNRPFSNVTRCACSFVTWPLCALNRVVETLYWRSQPSSCACEDRSCIGQSGQGVDSARAGGGSGSSSNWWTSRQPCRWVVPRQSEPVSPPPMMTTRLPLAVIGSSVMTSPALRLFCWTR